MPCGPDSFVLLDSGKAARTRAVSVARFTVACIGHTLYAGAVGMASQQARVPGSVAGQVA